MKIIYMKLVFILRMIINFKKLIEADKSGFFKFINIADGDYRIGAIEGKLNDFEYDYRKQRYGINF